ncbi:MAG: hypothetical protein KAU20_04800 [Nanoarchaeota archaeon]|nr:hypothetical protein [Nanoarchaeota archaeon]
MNTPIQELIETLEKSINVPMIDVVKETAYLNVLSICKLGLLKKEELMRILRLMEIKRIILMDHKLILKSSQESSTTIINSENKNQPGGEAVIRSSPP